MDNHVIDGHNHSHHTGTIKGLRLLFVILLNFVITAAEVAGGILSGSLSLVSDALHNFSDGLSVIISYWAIRISGRPGDYRRTFGYRRASIMAALFNSTVLIGISFFLFKQAYDKFMNPQAVNGTIVIWVALTGIVANLLCVLLLKKGAHGDINLKSTYIHLLSDFLSSIGVVVGGILILHFKIYWVDPLLTVLINIYILKESFVILKKAVHILMQGVPDNISIDEIVSDLGKIDGIEGIHHVHIWCMDENNIFFEAHVNIADRPVAQTKQLSKSIEEKLSGQYGVGHVTLQFEVDCCDNANVIADTCMKDIGK